MNAARAQRAAAGRGDEQLLQAHAPLLRYDPQDLFRAISAQSMVDNPGNPVLDADGEVVAEAARASTGDPGGPTPVLTLAWLGDHASRAAPQAERLAQAPGYVRDARRMQAPSHPFAGRVYGRVRRVDRRPDWLQYWLFYYYNPRTCADLASTRVTGKCFRST
jgi:hypothetical protein